MDADGWLVVGGVVDKVADGSSNGKDRLVVLDLFDLPIAPWKNGSSCWICWMDWNRQSQNTLVEVGGQMT